MAQWRSSSERMISLEQRLELLKAELQQYKEANQVLQTQYQKLKVQNDRMLKKEAEHQNAKTSLLHKRIIISRAVFLVPESLVIGDRLENCTIKVFRGNNVTVTDTAELINCRIIGLEHTYDGKPASKTPGTIEIRGVFYNLDQKKYAISTFDRVVVHAGARVAGNIRAGRIVVQEVTKVKGRLATWDRIREIQAQKEQGILSSATPIEDEEEEDEQMEESGLEIEINGSSEPLSVTEIG